MTREEALKIWLPIIKQGVSDMSLCAEALDMAIKALEQDPSYNSIKTELEPCEDAINRQAVLDGLASIAKVKAKSDAQKSLMGRVIFFVEQVPSVTPQPKMGKWIFSKILDKHYYCSECKSMGVDYWDFCPNCGAKMQEVRYGE